MKSKNNIIIVIHDMDLVDEVANRVVVLSENEIISDGKIGEIFVNRRILRKISLKAPVKVQTQGKKRVN
ncbi:MAG: hypothetical protein ACFFDC_16030 [Promethearchaeota archaeon]